MSYQDAIRKSQQKLGIQKKSSGKQQEAGGYEAALAKAQAKAGVTARQEQKSQNTNAKNRLKSGTLPLSPYGEKARTQKKEQKKTYAEGKQDYETAKRERLSAEARIQAASAGGWSPNSQTGKNAQKLAQEGLNARAKEREAESRLPALEQAARAKLAAEEQERVSKLPSAKKLRETRTESGLEAARANARAQAMMANPLAADMDEYARLRGQGDRAQKTYNEATENLRARYSVNRNEESMENAAQLVQNAPLRTGAPRYTSAQTGRQREAAAAVRTILSPERYATNQTSAQLWETNKLSKLTVEEKNAILGYAGAGEWDKAADLLDSLSDTLDARQQQEESETVDRYTAQGAGGAAFGTIWNVANAMGTQPFGMVENLRQAAENLVTGDVKPANPNSFFMGGAHAVQDTTARLVQKAQGTKLGQALGNETTSFLVENGLSILQNVSRIPLGTLSETASLALMSAGAAGGTALEQAQNGVSADEALTLSVVAGLAEYVTEKIPLDNILKNLGAPDETTVAKNLLEVLKRSILQMPTEGAEEALSDYINLIADGLVRADRSDFMQQIRDMEAMGYSKQEAVSAAILENVIKGPALSALGGAISGAVLGGGSSLLGYELYGSRGNAQSIQEQQLARVAETLGENGGKALQNAYLGTEDTADYAAGFSEYYEAGRKGQEVTESRYGDALNEVQKKAAYESGQMDAKKEAKKATFAQEKSTESGLVLDKYVSEHLNDHEIDRINTVSKMLGVRARFVEENSIRGGTANATISGDEVLIEQNNQNPVLFLVGHELTHRLQDIAETEYIAYRDSVQDMLAEEANQKRELYAKYGVKLTYEQALDEAAADFAGELAMGGEALDRFIANHKDNRTLLQKVLDALRSVTDKLTGAEKKRAEAAWGRTFTKEEWQGFKQAEKKLIQALKAGEKNANAEGESGERYSIGKTTENKPFVEVEQDILAGVPEADWVSTVKENLKKKFPNGITVGNSEIRIDGQSRQEMTFSRYMQWLYNNDQQLMADKLRATNNADEILSATTDWVNEGLNHPRKDRITDFARGNVLLRVGGNDYMADVVVGTRKNGSMVMYDVLNLQRTSFTEKETNAAISTNPSPGAARSTASVSTDSIAQAEKKDNGKFSLKEDSHGRELTEAQREYFKDSKVVDGEGRLKIVYHGSGAVFTEFSADFMSQHGSSEGQGFYFTDNKDMAEGYAEKDGQLLEGYLNISRPLSDSEVTLKRSELKKLIRAIDPTGDDLVLNYDPQGGMGYPSKTWYNRSLEATVDAIFSYNDTDSEMLAEIANAGAGAGTVLETVKRVLGYDGYIVEGKYDNATVYVAFNSNQFKNLDNQNPTSAPDIRFSLKGTEESRELSRLKKETEALKERVAYWKGQTKESTAVTTDEKSIEKKARQLVKDYGAQVDAAEIGADLTSLYNYIANNGDGKNELTGDEAWSRAREIARKVVENAVAVDDELYREYKDLRAYLKKTPLTISETDSRDIADFEAFRKANFGRLNVKKGETGNIDQVYTELMERWPEFFNGEQNNSVDMLTTIADVMRDIYDRTEGNPFSVYMEEAVNGAANDIMESFFELPQTRPTFADKQARKLEKAIADGKIRTQKAVEREKSRRANEVTKLKDRFAAKEKKGREAQNARVLRNRIEKHVSALSEKLLRPSDKKHIPEELRQSVAAMLNAINRESLYTIDENGKRHKNGEGDPVKRTEAFRALKAQYENILSSGDLVIDPDLMSNLDAVAKMEDIPLAKMNTEQLTTVWQAVKAVEASVASANKLFAAGKYETVSAAAEAIKMDNIRKKDKANYLETLGKIDKALNIDMLTPQAFFHRLGQSGDEMFRTMRKAQDKHITIMAQAQEEMAKIAGGRAVQNLEKETHTFRLSEGNVTMSTAQIMSLYALMQRGQGKKHVLNGGIRPDTVQGKSRFVDAARSDAIRISEGEVQDILDTLTDEQKHMADRIQNYFSTTLSDLGNEASMEVYGYKKFNEEHYFPIESDPQKRKSDASKEAEGGTIAGRGFTKSTDDNATNAVMLRSIFDVAANHISDMATYNAWLGTITDVQRIWNYKFWDKQEGEVIETVQDIFSRVFGKGGNTYMGQLLRDLNNGVKGNGGTLTSGLTANFKAAAIGANLRVIIQQPTAILRAMSEIDPAYLMAGSLRRGNWAKVQKYSPLSVWKDWGYFDVSTGRQMKNVLFSDDSRLERVKQASMALAGKADSFAWSRLWNAIELETKARRKDLTPGSNAFYEAVADRFEDVIDKTQVVDGILQRSQYMRNPDGLVKMASSFMAEPTKTYNQFLNAVYDLQNASEGEGKKKAKKYLARTTFALVSSFAVNAVMQSLMDALRDDDKEKKYWEKFVEAYTGLTGDEENFLTGFRNFMYGNFGSNFDPTSYVPFVKDIASVVQGYDVSRMDMDTISDLYRSMTNMNKALSGEGKMSLAAASAAMFAQAARLYGVPVANLKRDVEAAIKTAAIETDSYLMQYRIDKALMNLNYSGNRKNFLDILYNAYQNDEEEYEIIYADMVASGFDEAAIISGMESRMKKSQGVESVAELEQRFLSPSMQKQYDATMSRIQSSSIWKQSDETQQKAVQDNVYDLLNGTDEKLAEKVSGAAQQGIDESQYILYMAAQKLADAANRNPEKRNGTIDQKEAAAAIDMMGGLSNAQKSYLWQSTNKGWKEKNNPYR